jgi:hypothetical protein
VSHHRQQADKNKIMHTQSISKYAALSKRGIRYSSEYEKLNEFSTYISSKWKLTFCIKLYWYYIHSCQLSVTVPCKPIESCARWKLWSPTHFRQKEIIQPVDILSSAVHLMYPSCMGSTEFTSQDKYIASTFSVSGFSIIYTLMINKLISISRSPMCTWRCAVTTAERRRWR